MRFFAQRCHVLCIPQVEWETPFLWIHVILFVAHEDVLQLTRTIAYDIGFVVVITRSDNDTGKRERTSFILIGCERSGKYRAYKKDLVRTTTDSRKCGCSFKLGEKPVLGGER